MKTFFTLACFLTLISGCGSDFKVLTSFLKYYDGEAGSEITRAMAATSDGGYILVGETTSFGAGGKDVWAVKTNANGDVVWQQTFGGVSDDFANGVTQTSDQGYLISAQTSSFGAGQSDLWMLKLNPNGGIEWQKAFGGSANDSGTSAIQLSDGSYVVTGRTASFGSGSIDIWILKLDKMGEVLWEKTLGGPNDDIVYQVHEMPSGNLLIAANSYSIPTFNFGRVLLFALDASGTLVWQKYYGGNLTNKLDLITCSSYSDNEWLVGGTTSSFADGAAVSALIMKLNNAGEVSFARVLVSNAGTGVVYAFNKTKDGKLLAAGSFDSFGAMKLSSDGKTFEWNWQYGKLTPTYSLLEPGFSFGNGKDTSPRLVSMLEASDGSVVVGGSHSRSTSASPFGFGLIKTEADGKIGDHTPSGTVDDYQAKLIFPYITDITSTITVNSSSLAMAISSATTTKTDCKTSGTSAVVRTRPD